MLLSASASGGGDGEDTDRMPVGTRLQPSSWSLVRTSRINLLNGSSGFEGNKN